MQGAISKREMALLLVGRQETRTWDPRRVGMRTPCEPALRGTFDRQVEGVGAAGGGDEGRTAAELYCAMVTRRVPSKPKKRAKKALNPNEALWRDLDEIARSIPKESLAKLPRDLAEQFDHYHDGTPRQD